MPISSNSFKSVSDYFANRSFVGSFMVNPVGFTIILAIILIIAYYVNSEYNANFFIATGLSILAVVLFRDTLVSAKAVSKNGSDYVNTINSSISLKPRLVQPVFDTQPQLPTAQLTGNSNDLLKI